MLNFKCPWTGEVLPAEITESKYVFKRQNRLYLGLLTEDEDFGFMSPYCDITVNLPDEPLSGENCGFVDTNNAPFLPDWLEENGLAEPTGMFGFSGWCAYPEYRFNMDEIHKHMGEEA